MFLYDLKQTNDTPTDGDNSVYVFNPVMIFVLTVGLCLLCGQYQCQLSRH